MCLQEEEESVQKVATANSNRSISKQMQISPELTQIFLEEEITTANQKVDDLMEWVFGGRNMS